MVKKVELRAMLNEIEKDCDINEEAREFLKYFIDGEYYIPEGNEYVSDFVCEHVEADIYWSDLTDWLLEDNGYHVEEFLNECGWTPDSSFWQMVQAAQERDKNEQVIDNLDDIKEGIAMAYMIHVKGMAVVDFDWLAEVLADLPDARYIDKFEDIYDVIDEAIEEIDTTEEEQ